MFRLVNTHVAAPGKGQFGKPPPPLFAHLRNSHLLRFEVSQSRGKVVAHKEKLVLVVLLGIVKCRLKWRHGENQPAVASINARKLEHIAKKGPIGFGILGIDNDMRSIDQAWTPVTERARMFSLRRYLRNRTLGIFGDGSTRSLPTASWTSSAIDVATISTVGLATGVVPGTTTITATSGGVNGTTTLSVEVEPTLVSITVGHVNPSLAVGATLQFTATGTFNDGSIKVMTGSVMWSSTAPNVASISSGGLATGIASGVTTIAASSGSINGTTSLTITQH